MYFRELVADFTGRRAGRALDAVEQWLNDEHGVGSPTFEAFRHACLAGVAQGWMCEREGGGIRYGRVFPASDELHRFSVDVVDMADVVGPHHAHPQGEIDLIMPVAGDARFDGRTAGWCVYPPARTVRPSRRSRLVLPVA